MRVAIVGILPRQQQRMKDLCKGVDVVWFEKPAQAVGRRFSGCQKVIVMRHCDHNVTQAAQTLLGYDNVRRLRATGTQSVLVAISDMLRQSETLSSATPNPSGGRKRA